ncbi:MAG: RC-LH1 core complex protein PufX [Pseudomonadota bacterium]
MSDQNDIFQFSRESRLRMDVLGLMLKGASYAALLVIGIWAFIYVIYLIGLTLPEESKEAGDPTPIEYSETNPGVPAVYDNSGAAAE